MLRQAGAYLLGAFPLHLSYARLFPRVRDEKPDVRVRNSRERGRQSWISRCDKAHSTDRVKLALSLVWTFLCPRPRLALDRLQFPTRQEDKPHGSSAMRRTGASYRCRPC